MGPPQPDAMEPVGVAGWVGWRESSLTRAKELESLYAWMRKSDQLKGYDANALQNAIACHIKASRQAAEAAKPWPRKWLRNGALLERALKTSTPLKPSSSGPHQLIMYSAKCPRFSGTSSVTSFQLTLDGRK